MSPEQQNQKQTPQPDNSEDSGKDSNSQDTSNQNDAVLAKLAEIEKKVDAGKDVSAEDTKLIAALLAGDNGDGKSNGKDKGSDLSSIDVDGMNNAQLVDHIVKVVQLESEKTRKEMFSRMEETDKKAIQLEVDQEVNYARKKYGKDFEDSWDDIAKTADKHPELTAEECFLLTSGRKTFSELSEKIKKEQVEKEKQKVILGVSSASGVNNEALLENLAGKTHHDVAAEIAQRLGV